MDIENIVSNKVKELIDNKTIENAIKANIEKTILSNINSIFNGYEFSSSIRNMINAQIGNIAETVKLNSYNSLIVQTVEDVLNKQVKDDLKEKLKSVIEKQFLVTEKEIKLSDVVNAMKEDLNNPESHSFKVTVRDYTSCWDSGFKYKEIKFLCNDDKNDDYSYDIRIGSCSESKPYTIFAIYHNKFDVKNISLLNTYNDFECLLIKAYLNKIPFVIDITEDDCEYALNEHEDC